MKYLITLFATILSSFSFSFSKTNSTTVQTPSFPTVPIYLKSQTDSITAGTYKMLYDNQVKANDAVLKTIFYALGGLGSAMIFVFASNWWFNEKKVRDIKNGISTKISSEINEMRSGLQKEITTSSTNLTSLFNEFKDKINDDIKEDNKTLLDNYQTQLQSFSGNINIQISTLKTSLDERIAAVQKASDISNQQTQELIEEIKNKIEIANKKLKIETLGNEAALWLIKEIPLNAFRCYLEEGKYSVEINYIWNLKYVFEDLEAVLKKIPTVRQSDVDAFNKFINCVPDGSYVVEKANVTEMFNKKQVRE